MEVVKRYVRAEQLIKCNVRFVDLKNQEGIRNTLAIKYDEYDDKGYDLIQQKFIPFYKDNIKGVCMEVLNVPFENSHEVIDIYSLDSMLKKYRENIQMQNSLFYTDNSLELEINEKYELKKQRIFKKSRH